MLAWARVGLALRRFAESQAEETGRALQMALEALPDNPENAACLAQMVKEEALGLPVEPGAYIKAVFASLPSGGWRRNQRQARAEVEIACAFEDYFAARYPFVVRRVLTAILRQPAWLTNRGVWAILARSILKSTPQP